MLIMVKCYTRLLVISSAGYIVCGALQLKRQQQNCRAISITYCASKPNLQKSVKISHVHPETAICIERMRFSQS